MRPDRARVHALGVFLGRALADHPAVRLFAAVQMSNHIHLVLEDGAGVLDRFMAQLLSPLAKALNGMDGIRGTVWERRYSALEIVDDAALVDRIAYTVTNPVAADLVERAEAWPGLVLAPGFTESGTFTRFRKRANDRACEAAGPAETVDPGAFEEEVAVGVESPTLELGDARELARAAVAGRTAMLRRRRGDKRVLGVGRVLEQKVFDAPRRSKRSPAPLCHAGSAELWEAFRVGWQKYVAAYREASAAFRAGVLHCPFPDWSFRPSLPIFHE